MEACAGERRREHGARGFSAPSGGHGSARPAPPAAGCAAENRPAAAAGGGSVRGSLLGALCSPFPPPAEAAEQRHHPERAEASPVREKGRRLFLALWPGCECL